jgi:hypothetical protein
MRIHIESWIRIRIHLKSWIRIRTHKINADPKLWQLSCGSGGTCTGTGTVTTKGKVWRSWVLEETTKIFWSTGTKYSDVLHHVALSNKTYWTCAKMQFIFQSRFYMFVDDDYYVSTRNLLRFLRNPVNYPRYLGTNMTACFSSSFNFYYSITGTTTISGTAKKLILGFLKVKIICRNQSHKFYRK